MTLSTDELRAIPKVQTHIHLDGSVRQETIWDIAQSDGVEIGVASREELARKSQVIEPMSNLEEVLDVFWVHQKVLHSYDSIKRVTLENVEDAYLDGVKLVELRFAPTFIAYGKDKLSNDEIISGVLDGIAEGMARFPIEVGLISIGPRNLDPADNMRALEDVLRYKRGSHAMADRIVGYDLAAGEAGTQPEEYRELINAARDGGLGITIHSGEDTEGPHVRRTIEVLGAQRIGHGINAWGHHDIVEFIKQRNVHLEISITSNWLTQLVPTVADHPVRGFFDAGVSISINTDDPHLMGIDLMNEYRLLNQVFGFSRDELLRLNRDALTHSFLPEPVKAQVRAEYFATGTKGSE